MKCNRIVERTTRELAAVSPEKTKWVQNGKTHGHAEHDQLEPHSSWDDTMGPNKLRFSRRVWRWLFLGHCVEYWLENGDTKLVHLFVVLKRVHGTRLVRKNRYRCHGLGLVVDIEISKRIEQGPGHVGNTERRRRTIFWMQSLWSFLKNSLMPCDFSQNHEAEQEATMKKLHAWFVLLLHILVVCVYSSKSELSLKNLKMDE